MSEIKLICGDAIEEFKKMKKEVITEPSVIYKEKI